MAGRSAKLHLGCGLVTPEGWLNVDGSLNARLARLPWLRALLGAAGLISKEAAAATWSRSILHHDVRRPLPWPDGAFECVYASHLLEHLYLNQGRRLLAECFRVLRPGGVVRIVVPDLHVCAEAFLAGKTDSALAMPHGCAKSPGDNFNLLVIYHGVDEPGGPWGTRWYHRRNTFHQHKWMYDEPSLSARLREAGFTGVARRGYLESAIASIAEVEREVRVVGNLAVEGVKPA